VRIITIPNGDWLLSLNNYNVELIIDVNKNILQMIHNVGKIDRIIRLSLALIFVGLYYFEFADGEWSNYFLIGAFVLFITSSRRCCPIYAIVGFGTCGIETNNKEPIIKTKKIKL